MPPRDAALAMRYCRRAADLEYDHAYLPLGTMHLLGDAGAIDTTEAAKWIRRAADRGLKKGLPCLGELYELGTGVPQDLDLAVSNYRRAAAKGSDCARVCLANRGLRYGDERVSLEEARSCLAKAARSGWCKAQLELGWAHALGEAGDRDYDRAAYWCEKAFEDCLADTAWTLGVLDRRGLGASRDLGKAANWLRMATLHGHMKAKAELADLAAQGDDAPADPQRAAEQLSRVRDLSDPDIQCLVGSTFDTGFIGPRDRGHAELWYEKSARQGHPGAQLLLALLHWDGRAHQPDRETAERWFRAAADQQFPFAMYLWGRMLERGRFGPPDPAEAAAWYRKAAAMRVPEAQTSLGRFHEHGIELPTDHEKAARLYRHAARRGDHEAQWRFGCMVSEGKGVPQDAAEAARWWQKAAEQLHPPAQRLLGNAFLEGSGVDRDLVKAWAWLQISAEEGDEQAGELLDAVAGRMTEDQLRAAKRLNQEIWSDLYNTDAKSRNAATRPPTRVLDETWFRIPGRLG